MGSLKEGKDPHCIICRVDYIQLLAECLSRGTDII